MSDQWYAVMHSDGSPMGEGLGYFQRSLQEAQDVAGEVCDPFEYDCPGVVIYRLVRLGEPGALCHLCAVGDTPDKVPHNCVDREVAGEG